MLCCMILCVRGGHGGVVVCLWCVISFGVRQCVVSRVLHFIIDDIRRLFRLLVVVVLPTVCLLVTDFAFSFRSLSKCSL